MGIWTDVLWPWGYDFFTRSKEFDARRSRILAHAQGSVLELGIGTGSNLPHYPEAVDSVTGIDPNPGMQRQLTKKMRKSALIVHRVMGEGGQLPFANASFDTVVSTLVLCSIPALDHTLGEIRRVLRPDGRFVYLEHGVSPDPRVARWQKRLNGVQRIIGAGCQLDLSVTRVLEKSGFRLESVDASYLKKGPKTHSYIYEGVGIAHPG